MASPAKTTSSIPYRANPNMKISELCDTMRRSFSGNPFTKPSVITNPGAFNPSTPANSPSDFPRRYSTGRESAASLRDPDKENHRDQNSKPTRVRSPAFSKVTKNFMSPTISAASKINASPRKKILVERNEPVRSSASFSDVKSLIMEDCESTPEIALKEKVSFPDVKRAIMEDESTPEIGLNQKKVSFSDVKTIIMEDNELTPQIGLKEKNAEVPNVSESSSHEHEEPLKSNTDFDYKESKNDSVDAEPLMLPYDHSVDAEPLMLPYDPKSNYLSPRPQFLHYRPNPRIEHYREREGKQLEEHFAYESYSDTDVTDGTLSEGSQRESEDISLEETMKEGEEEEELHASTMKEGEEEEELHASEPNPMASDMVGKKFEAKIMSKPRFSIRSKFIALLLFLAFAYFSVLVANSPAFAPGLEELSLASFYIPTEFTDYAKANFNRFTQNIQHWSGSFLSYVSNIISGLTEVHKVNLSQYDNFSHLIEDHISHGHLMFDHSILEPVRERDSGTEQFYDKYYGEIETDKSLDEEDEQELEEQEEDKDKENEAYEHLELVSEEETVAEMIKLDHLEADENKRVEFNAQIDVEHRSNVEVRDQPRVISQATEIQHDISRTGGDPEGDDLNTIAETVFLEEELKSDNLNTEDSTDNTQSSEVADSIITGKEDQFLAKNVMDFSLLVLSLLAASALIYTKQGRPSMPNDSVPMEQPVLGKNSECSPLSGSKDTIRERQTEGDMTNESSSEMSSCQMTSLSYGKKGLKESNEYQSQERKTRKIYRRESLASSDYSYGSFTTYEKIPIKHGGEEEEIVTPVRRSSRIRNQVTAVQFLCE